MASPHAGDHVGALSAALVREWLARSGFKDALAKLDEARPPRADDICSRNGLMQVLPPTTGPPPALPRVSHAARLAGAATRETGQGAA